MRTPRAAERLARAPEALRGTGADVIALQEVFRPGHRRFIAAALRGSHPHVLAPPPLRSVLGSGLMVLSAVPIRAGGLVPLTRVGLVERGVLSVALDHPLLSATRLINVHARAGPAARHNAEIDHLLAVAAGQAIMLGDFNCGPGAATWAYDRIVRAGFADAYGTAGSLEAPTWDAANPLNKAGRFRFEPSQRIDHVFVPRTLAPHVAAARILLRYHDEPLSDHYGLIVELTQKPVDRQVVRCNPDVISNENYQ